MELTQEMIEQLKADLKTAKTYQALMVSYIYLSINQKNLIGVI